MIVGERLRAIRESKKMSQGDIERKTGLLRCYISRVENGHTVPAVETLEKLARAMDVELYQIFFEANGHKQPEALNLPELSDKKTISRKEANLISNLARLVQKMDDADKKLLLGMAQKLAGR